MVAIDSLIIDPEIQLQSRGIDGVTVQGYVEALSGGAEFPPVVAFSENGNLWLADGFHRVEASRFCGVADIGADIREGSRKDAKIHASLANVEHGKPMSQAQKREAGRRLLELTKWADREIARRLAVGKSTVARWHNELSVPSGTDAPRMVIRNGTTYTMDTSNIGQARPQLQDGETVRGPRGAYRLLDNDVKQCEQCGELWAAELDYCPYCHIPREARIAYLRGLDVKIESEDIHRIQIRSNNEWYTPSTYLEAARAVMGAIDVDPASSASANENVKADVFYSKADDGLIRDWPGRVWLNPPYGVSGPLFVARLLEQFRVGIAQEAVLLVNSNATETQWFAPLWDHLLCFVYGRINFISNVGERNGSTHGSVFVYLGRNGEEFRRVFSQFGPIVKRVG